MASATPSVAGHPNNQTTTSPSDSDGPSIETIPIPNINVKKSKKHKKKKPQMVTPAIPVPPPPLFATTESRSGAVRTVFHTNDTTTMLRPIPTLVVQQQLDTVLEAVRTLDTTCDFERCRTKTSLMHQDCVHCARRFCFKHGLPEVHGCGVAVRRSERERFMHPVPQKTRQTETDRREAHARMEQRLKDMNLARKAKTGSNNKKKS